MYPTLTRLVGRMYLQTYKAEGYRVVLVLDFIPCSSTVSTSMETYSVADLFGRGFLCFNNLSTSTAQFYKFKRAHDHLQLLTNRQTHTRHGEMV